MPKPFFPFLGAVSLLAVGSLGAQTPQESRRLPDGGTLEVLVSIFIPSQPGAPFTAIVNTEWVRALPDGTRITVRNHRMIARDKSGRIFQERRALVPESERQESGITQTEISDPVAHEQIICTPYGKTCQVEVFYPSESAPQEREKAPQQNPDKPGKESLGKQMIAGLDTIGTKEVTVIPTGAIGNDSPILARREYWYSAQLGVNLLSTREDPRFGTQKFELSDIVLGDPDAKLFVIPEGFKVIDLRKETNISPQETSPQ
jgi:hypothetical protein